MTYHGTPSSIVLSFVASAPNAGILTRSSPSIRTLEGLMTVTPTLRASVGL